MIEAKFLPCPFCGQAPSLRTNYCERDGDGHTCFIVECLNESCGVKSVCVACGPHGYGKQDGDCATNEEAKAELAKKWNRRDCAAPDMLSALRECVAWFEDNCVDCYALDEAREALKKARGESS